MLEVAPDIISPIRNTSFKVTVGFFVLLLTTEEHHWMTKRKLFHPQDTVGPCFQDCPCPGVWTSTARTLINGFAVSRILGIEAHKPSTWSSQGNIALCSNGAPLLAVHLVLDQ